MAVMDSSGMAARLLIGQAKILAGIAAGTSLPRTLGSLAELVQEATPDALVSVLLLDESGTRLRVGAAPGLPAEYNALIDGFLIGPEAGCCGTAAYTGKVVVSENLAADARWAPLHDALRGYGLQACWSSPIFSRLGKVLGTFAMYYREPGGPSAGDLEMIGVAAHLAAVAIEQASAEEARRRSEGKFQAVFDHAFSAMLIVDDEQSILDANPAASLLLGVPQEDLVGKHLNIFSEPVLPKDLPNWNAAWQRFITEGEFSGERIIRNADGSEHRAFFHAKANYQPGQHLCVMLDVTQLRRSEQAVAQTEHLYRTLVETTNTGYCVLDPKGAIVDANTEYVRLTGFESLEEIRGHSVQEWIAPHDQQRHADEIRRCAEQGTVTNLEVDCIDRAGRITPVEINARSIQTEAGALLLALVRDITARQLVQNELQTARAELESRVQQRTAELALANAQIRQRALQQEAVAAFGRQALLGSALDTLLQEAAEQVASTLDVAVACVMEHIDGAEKFILRACAGWLDAPIGSRASYAGKNTQSGQVMRTQQPLIVEDLSAEPRFVAVFEGFPQPLLSGMSVMISGEDAPYGVLMAHSTQRREFTQDDIHFLQSMANVLAAAIERKHSEQALQIAQQTAVRANNAKSDFLSRMSHELRTPLNAILGFGQLLEIDHLNTSQQESVSQIVRAGKHLLTLVDEVLDISRIEAGQLSLAPEPVPAAGLLREAMDLLRPLASSRGISMTLRPELADGGYYVLADRQRLRQVFLNLISNAVKYNRAGGTVELRGALSPGGERLRLEVRDTGIGMSPAKLALLFKPFERLGAEYTGIEGNGMGLALSKRLIDSQRGRIGAESVEGAGSTFWVELPVAVAPEDDDDEPALSVALLEEIFAQSSVLNEDPAEEYGSEPAKLPAPPEKQIVLHIEDNESNRRLIEMLLVQRPSLKLVSAARGEEGLELARAHHPALILLDMHLPDTTGEDVLSHLRAEEGTRATPVVVVSADATAARSQKLRAAGANDYLTKPFNVVQFLKILDDYLFKGKAAGK